MKPQVDWSDIILKKSCAASPSYPMWTLWQECADCQCSTDNNRCSEKTHQKLKIPSINVSWERSGSNNEWDGGRSHKDFVQWWSFIWEWIWTSFEDAIPQGISTGIALFWWFYQLHCIRPWLILVQNISISAKRSICSFTTYWTDEYKTVVSLLYWLSYKSICEILRGNMQIVWGGVAGVQGYIGGVQGEGGVAW